MSYSKLIVPSGFLHGNLAHDAIANGLALPIGGSAVSGNAVGFCMAHIHYRTHQQIELLSVAQLLTSDDNEIQRQIANIAKLRTPMGKLIFSPPQLMGILNVTPDSFSDGGKFNQLSKVKKQVEQWQKLGLSIVDIGGESTRPNAAYIACDLEIERIAPVLEALQEFDICISVDTRKAKVMEFALGHGADVINDVSALEFRASHAKYGEDSGDSVQVILRHNCPIILMHSQGSPEVMQNAPKYENILFEIYDYLQQRIESLVSKGFDICKIIIDPGIGFGKLLADNLMLINNISLFHSLGVPLLIGASRKSMIGQMSNNDGVERRLGGSLALAQMAQNAGVHINRVHDVEETLQQYRIVKQVNNIR
ncbi:MAG: dihydropteroate synthase [Rhizobiales bacterium]|nr:dihydropteroate synthase [Hyphomicrobiales bacterium]NRB14152.1 dihydropteroate synthase [Hyphomicrobiales bacterium]